MKKTDVINKRFSELIGDTYKSWKDTRIILDGGTGTGKTYFVLKNDVISVQSFQIKGSNIPGSKETWIAK